MAENISGLFRAAKKGNTDLCSAIRNREWDAALGGPAVQQLMALSHFLSENGAVDAINEALKPFQADPSKPHSLEDLAKIGAYNAQIDDLSQTGALVTDEGSYIFKIKRQGESTFLLSLPERLLKSEGLLESANLFDHAEKFYSKLEIHCLEILKLLACIIDQCKVKDFDLCINGKSDGKALYNVSLNVYPQRTFANMGPVVSLQRFLKEKGLLKDDRKGSPALTEPAPAQG